MRLRIKIAVIKFLNKVRHKITSFAFIVAKEVSFHECAELKSAELILTIKGRE
jgi:hypothetical protein